ncbi:MAG: hypothetical protein ABIJ14_02775, partial [Nanoarchaeota archaeon]
MFKAKNISGSKPFLPRSLSRNWDKSKEFQPSTTPPGVHPKGHEPQSTERGGKKPAGQKINFSKKLLFIGFAGLFLLLCLSFVVNLGLTGKVSLDVKSKYTQGEIIKGDLKFSLKEGELIPANSKLIINLGGTIQEFILSDLVDSGLVEGEFY